MLLYNMRKNMSIKKRSFRKKRSLRKTRSFRKTRSLRKKRSVRRMRGGRKRSVKKLRGGANFGATGGTPPSGANSMEITDNDRKIVSALKKNKIAETQGSLPDVPSNDTLYDVVAQPINQYEYINNNYMQLQKLETKIDALDRKIDNIDKKINGISPPVKLFPGGGEI